jgi:hypothetical protein
MYRSPNQILLIPLALTLLAVGMSACNITISPLATPVPQVVTVVVPVTQIPTTSSQIEVFANRGWQNTGVFIQAGQFLKVTYLRGTWSQCGGGGGACAFADADGLDFESPDDNVMPSGCKDEKLIARINDFLPICVGGHYSGRVSQSGQLSLRMNDAVVNDNVGSVTVLVEVTN